MAQQGPTKKAVPVGVATGAAQKVQPAQPAMQPVKVSQQAQLQAKVRQAQTVRQEEEEFDEERSTWEEWLRQSPSWVTSMVFHAVLILILALITFQAQQSYEKPLLISDSDNDEELLEEPEDDDAPDVPVEQDQPEVEYVINEEFEVEQDELQIPTEHDDVEPPTLSVPFLENVLTTTATNNLLADLPGLVGSGLGNRTLAGRRSSANRAGGGGDTEAAVEAALKWLADHQNRDGSWNFTHTPGDRCNGFPDPGNTNTKMGATGIALLPFLGAGYTHKDGKYKKTVEAGLDYLVRNMISDDTNGTGKLYEKKGPAHALMYSHGLCAMALAEAYGMTQDARYQAAAQKALNFIISAQSPEGGWRYRPREGSDTSVVGWQVLALKSGELSYLQVDDTYKDKVMKFLVSVAWGDYGEAYGYQGKRDRRAWGATTAIGMLCRIYLGWKRDHSGFDEGIALFGNHGPSNNMYRNYYASMVLFQLDGEKGPHWTKWNKRMKRLLTSQQVKEGKQRGSWYFEDGFGDHGGRVYNTAMGAMTLEVYYRYLPIYRQENVGGFPDE